MTSETGDRFITVVLNHIHQHFDRKLSIDDLIQLVPLSRRLLEERFKKETGLPIYTYIMNFRMYKFAMELIETNSPICEIADSSGYSDYKNIARLFKQKMGCTATEYRKKYKKSENSIIYTTQQPRQL